MTKQKVFVAVSLMCAATTAHAQTATCMNLGPDMVQCNGSDGRSTNCMRMGNTMATCNTTGGYQADGGAQLGQGVVDLVRGINERSFRSKVGKLLASGDCDGAVKYAFEKGRIELGNSLAEHCSTRSVSAAAPHVDVVRAIGELAARTKAPVQVKSGLALTNVEARGTQLLMTFVTENTVTDQDAAFLTGLVEEACASNELIDLMREGATFRGVMLDFDGQQVSTAMATAAGCGIK